MNIVTDPKKCELLVAKATFKRSVIISDEVALVQSELGVYRIQLRHFDLWAH